MSLLRTSLFITSLVTERFGSWKWRHGRCAWRLNGYGWKRARKGFLYAITVRVGDKLSEAQARHVQADFMYHPTRLTEAHIDAMRARARRILKWSESKLARAEHLCRLLILKEARPS